MSQLIGARAMEQLASQNGAQMLWGKSRTAFLYQPKGPARSNTQDQREACEKAMAVEAFWYISVSLGLYRAPGCQHKQNEVVIVVAASWGDSDMA